MSEPRYISIKQYRNHDEKRKYLQEVKRVDRHLEEFNNSFLSEVDNIDHENMSAEAYESTYAEVFEKHNSLFKTQHWKPKLKFIEPNLRYFHDRFKPQT